ncbi:MAG: cupin domain-containing protein [Planctomycetota bacterium]|jgi:quercetin dioxygenase-like cupin family protein
MSIPPLDTPTDLSDLVAWQDGTVVSRTIVKSRSGTVTAFAFDAGEGLSEHTAPFDALLLLLDGEAAVTVGGKRHTLGAGRIIRLPADVPHAVHAEQRFKMLLVMIRERDPDPT